MCSTGDIASKKNICVLLYAIYDGQCIYSDLDILIDIDISTSLYLAKVSSFLFCCYLSQ